MAAKRVESYLDYHKIGPLFEDLMAKLIKEMPEQPVPFLIKLLKRQNPEEIIPHSRPPSGSKSRSSLSSSMGLTGKPISRQSLDDSKEMRRSALAKSWAAPDSSDRPGSASKIREYDRPWLHGSKKAKGDHTQSNKENARHGSKRTEEKASTWNKDTKVPFNDFDEWFEAQNKRPQSAGNKTRDIERKPSWTSEQEDLDSSMDKRGIGYPLQVQTVSSQPLVRADYDEDLEGEEIGLSRRMKTRGESSEGNSVSSYSSGHSSKKNARNAAKEHRRQLESLLLNSDSTCPSKHHRGILSDDDKDDATELLESSNELESEGVSKPTHSGFKLSKSVKGEPSSPENVKVSICARCARIISGLPSDQKSEVASNFSTNSDEDFDSVSQTGSATGEPRRITWPSGFDSESEALTPKKGRPMWDKNATPQKGKHMYMTKSTFLTDLVGSPSPRPLSAASDRSEGTSMPKPGKGWQQKDRTLYSSDNDTDVNVKYDRSSSPSTTRLATGRPWTRPLDSASDAGSEDWTQDRNKKVSFKSKGFRRSYQTDDSDY